MGGICLIIFGFVYGIVAKPVKKTERVSGARLFLEGFAVGFESSPDLVFLRDRVIDSCHFSFLLG